jgi:NAD(P)-dependent dehydrogenase (short-subunit alcohol dehydrogenase family)
MGVFAVTGIASGMGAATGRLLRAAGHQVIGIDRHEADLQVDLATPAGRQAAIGGVREASGGRLDGAAMFAGLAGATGRPGSLLVSVNYFGTTELLDAFRPLLAVAGESSAVAISSNSATCQPGWRPELAQACLSGDEARARAIADEGDSVAAYPATKLAIARWVRRQAPTKEWAGAGIRLNAVAPGLIETPMVAETRSDPVLGPLIGAFPLPLGRGGTAEELAALVTFLLGPQARFFCGSVLFCDGGTDALLRSADWPARWSPSAQ